MSSGIKETDVVVDEFRSDCFRNPARYEDRVAVGRFLLGEQPNVTDCRCCFEVDDHLDAFDQTFRIPRTRQLFVDELGCDVEGVQRSEELIPYFAERPVHDRSVAFPVSACNNRKQWQ